MSTADVPTSGNLHEAPLGAPRRYGAVADGGGGEHSDDDVGDDAPLLSAARALPDPPLWFRAFILFIVSLVCFGSYFALDSVQPLQPTFASQIAMSPAQFQLLYSVYSLPNIVLPFFGGLLADRLGLRVSSMLLAALVTFGAALVAIAPMRFLGLPNLAVFGVMAAGRTLFGAGAESLNVTQIAMTTAWFREGKSLALAFAFVLSMSRLGDLLALSFLANITTALTGDLKTGYPVALWIAAALCFLSFVATVVYAVADRFAAKRYFREVPKPDKFGLKTFTAVFTFELRFWLTSALVLTYYSGVFPFIGMLAGWLHDKYGYDAETAGLMSGTIVLSSMILSPFLGKAVDLVGRRPLVAIAGSFVILPAHLVLAMTGPDSEWTVWPLWPIAAVGLSFSLVPSALWPCVPLVVPAKYNAFSFGVMTAIQNGGLAAVNYIVGEIRSHPNGDRNAMYFFVAVDALGLLLGIMLLVVDWRRGGALASVKEAEPAAQAPDATQTKAPQYTINVNDETDDVPVFQ